MNRTAVLALVASLTAASPLLAQEVKFEGRGDYRQKMDAMQGTKFDQARWKSLAAWTGSAPFSAETTKDKVVCIVTWASWNNASAKALQEAQKAATAYGGKGLLVVGVHDRNGWDQAAQVIGANKVTFPVAHDESGEFIKALGSDAHPDVFVIDRAGNMRFADIMTDSIDTAVKQLVAETPEQAAAAASAPKADKPAEAAKGNGKYVAPPASAYAAAKWPDKNTQQLSAKDMQGKPLPAGGLGQEKYLSAKPNRDGKVTVIDFWATWCGPCRAVMPKLDAFQKEQKDDLVIIGLSDEPEATVKSFLQTNKHDYAQGLDVNKRLGSGLAISGIPHVVVLSSDGVIRWQGNPHDPKFQDTVKAVIKADPGVKARREAEKKG